MVECKCCTRQLKAGSDAVEFNGKIYCSKACAVSHHLMHTSTDKVPIDALADALNIIDKDAKKIKVSLENTNVTDTCMWCSRDLSELDEVHAVEGLLYCSEKCAVDSQEQLIIQSARSMARQWYENGHEIVSTTDIGIK